MNRQKALKPIALIKTGGTIPDIKREYGDFEEWFSAGLGDVDVQQVDVYENQPLPPLENLAGIVITGSASMVSHKEDWSEKTAAWLKQAVEADVPVLGVCYGHQLLAQALGGVVGPNPNGRQIGTVTATMLESSANDPLLGELPSTYEVQTSHSESVLEMPPGATRLATSPKDDNFVIRFADKVWGVQYHPEFSAPVMAKYITYRADDIINEGLDPVELLEGLENTPVSLSVLKRFADLVS
jgi:GMP synthase (glutamine-hydrolysing)